MSRAQVFATEKPFVENAICWDITMYLENLLQHLVMADGLVNGK